MKKLSVTNTTTRIGRKSLNIAIVFPHDRQLVRLHHDELNFGLFKPAVHHSMPPSRHR